MSPGECMWMGTRRCLRTGPEATLEFRGQFHEKDPATKTSKEQPVR